MDLFDNSVSCRTSLAKYYIFCRFSAEVVRKLKFPNNYNHPPAHLLVSGGKKALWPFSLSEEALPPHFFRQ